jgi:hypothetical protein
MDTAESYHCKVTQSDSSFQNHYTLIIIIIVVIVVIIITTAIIMALQPFVGFGRFFSFLVQYTVGRTHWMGDQPIARLLPTH